jgi:hypothetical protein
MSFTTAADLTPAFFSEVLGTQVIGVSATPIGVGMVGANLLCRLTYANGASGRTDLPTSVVTKLPSTDETSRATGVALRNYEREVRFYQEIQPTVAIRVPKCFFSRWAPDTGDFVLVLEDLSPAEPGDQIRGCTVAEANTALAELARLHAPRWDDPTLHHIDWMSRRDPESSAFVAGLFRNCLPQFTASYASILPHAHLSLLEDFAPRLEDWFGARPEVLCVTHGDFRLDNLLFGSPAGGPPVAVVDWQTTGHGPAVGDAAYFLGAGLDVDVRRRHEGDLLGAYHRALTANGVTGFGFDECWEHYRLLSLAGVVMTVVASMIVGETERGREMFTAMSERHIQHAIDVGAMTTF